MGDSDGCRGNGDSAKPFPFSANEVKRRRGGGGRRFEQRSSQSRSQTQLEGLVTLKESDYSLLCGRKYSGTAFSVE